MRYTTSGFEFFMPSNGGYVRLESETKIGTLAPQICEGGGFSGSTVSSTPATFERDCKKWARQNKRNAARHGSTCDEMDDSWAKAGRAN